jgi:hypothetical protein
MKRDHPLKVLNELILDNRQTKLEKAFHAFLIEAGNGIKYKIALEILNQEKD